MLVLSRKVGEEIVIPGLGITFAILEIRGDRVRVGVTAPRDVTVHRHEVWDRLLARGARGDLTNRPEGDTASVGG